MNCKTCWTAAEERIFTTFKYWHCPKCKDDAEINRNKNAQPVMNDTSSLFEKGTNYGCPTFSVTIETVDYSMMYGPTTSKQAAMVGSSNNMHTSCQLRLYLDSNEEIHIKVYDHVTHKTHTALVFTNRTGKRLDADAKCDVIAEYDYSCGGWRFGYAVDMVETLPGGTVARTYHHGYLS